MIDEELYEQAADELNSQRRRPHIWARACALANDDHDEARFLYTNLRVEELLAEREREGLGQAQAAEAADDSAVLDSLELEPVGGLPNTQGARNAQVEQETQDTSAAFGALEEGAHEAESHEAEPHEAEPHEAEPREAEPHEAEPTPKSAASRFVAETELPFATDEDETLDLGSGETVTHMGITDPTETSARPGPPTSLERNAADSPRRPGDPIASGEFADLEGLLETTDAADGPNAAAPSGDPESSVRSREPDARHEPDEPRPAHAAGTPHASTPSDGSEPHDVPSVPDARAEPRGSEAPAPETLAIAPRKSDSRRTPAPDEPSPASGRSASDRALEPDRLERKDTVVGTSPDAGAGSGAASGLDDLEWLDEAYRAERRTLAPSTPPDALDTPDASDDEELAQELRRQADALPIGGPGTVIPHEEPAAEPARVRPPQRSADSGTGSLDEESFVGARPGADEIEPGLIALDPVAAPRTTRDEPLELVDEPGGGEEYAVFAGEERDGESFDRLQAVRQGGSWWALLFTLPWLLYHRLIGTAIIYALFSVVVLAGLIVTGLAWLDAGSAASLATKGVATCFALLAVIGLVVVPFRSANHWREDKLERRGFELLAYVRARSAERAIACARTEIGGGS